MKRLIARGLKFLPRKAVLQLFGTIANFRRPKKSYSQKGEDIILASYFAKRRVRQGFYCDIGCFHPRWISNTHLFHEAGWRGVAVDIDRDKLAVFKKARGENVATVFAGIVDEACEGQTAEVYKFERLSGWSDIDTLDKEVAETSKAEGRGNYTTTIVPIMGINDFLASQPHINLLNIDIEGLDKMVLDTLDLEHFRPEAILFEDNDNWGGSLSSRQKLERHGYERLFVSGGSVCYVLPIDAEETTESRA